METVFRISYLICLASGRVAARLAADYRVLARASQRWGPLVVPLNIKIVDHLGNPFVLPAGKENVALCRCGHSKTKPFCDGSHKACAFQASESAPPPAPAP